MGEREKEFENMCKRLTLVTEEERERERLGEEVLRQEDEYT